MAASSPDVPKPASKPVTVSGFKFSERSKKNLEGVNPLLVDLTRKALTLSTVDFVVVEGVRTLERQKTLLEQGHTKTLNSRHLTGDAVDVVALVNGKVTWDEEYYFPIADAFAVAARRCGISVEWGAAWTFPLEKYALTSTPGLSANHDYKFARQQQGRKVFIDMVHFQLPRT